MTNRPDRRNVAADWDARGFSCDIWTDRPGQVWADFVHVTDELVLRPRPGEEVLIPARTSHTVINIGSTTNHWFYGYKRN